MLFNSIEFAIFLPIVFLLYWFVFHKNLSQQNILLLVVSYVFYAWWDWRFLFLLAFSTFLDYCSGLKIEQASTQAKSKFWLVTSIGINLGFLGFFKYYNFFISEFAQAIESIGFYFDPWLLNIILPVGISFYTFHGLSYIIDVYKKRIVAEKNFVEYAVFVSFFPLLVAGPIERATHLLPQIKKPRTFDYTKAVDGLRQILWGLFKKIVIADQCATYVNQIFGDVSNNSGSNLVIGALLFTFQIYCDFSGYSDIALGTARLFGIELLKNFSFPYFSRDIAEFWRRWHISLSTWFRDYLYIPLGGSRGGNFMKVRNTFAIFIVSGFWHGANWTFIAWGFLNALYIMPSIIFKTNRANLDIVAKGDYLPNLKDTFSIVLTFTLTVIAWIFFRASSIENAFHYLGRIFSSSLFSRPSKFPVVLFCFIGFMTLLEWIGREEDFGLQKIGFNWSRSFRYVFYFLIITSIFLYSTREQEFIYFQF